MTGWASLRALCARPRVLIGSMLLVVAFSYLMNAPGLSTSGAEFERLAGAPTFDFRFAGYSVDEFRETLTRAGDTGRAVYRRFMWLDVFFPAIYGTFWLGVFERVARAWGGRWRSLPVVPVATALIDYVENAFVALGVLSFPAEAPLAVRSASTATQLKGVATLLLVGCALAALGRWLVHRTRQR